VTLSDQLRAAGHDEGFREGLQKGRLEILMKQLSIRFGALSDATVARLYAAGLAELDLWAERVLTAPTLEEVLRDGAPEP
jgi:hypothetical protein